MAGIEERPSNSGRVTLVVATTVDAITGVCELVAPRWAVREVPVPDASVWRDGWRRHAQAVRAGDRLVIVPAWQPSDPAPVETDLVLTLDPGLAFGSGSHPTTRLALAALERDVAPGDAVLDVGCGSGILAVAAALLGAATVLGVDVEDEACVATQENAARNGVEDRVEATREPLRALAGPFDLVVANISRTVLVDLVPDLAPLVRGTLLVTGLLDAQAADVIAAYEPAGLTLGIADRADGWVLLRAELSPQPSPR